MADAETLARAEARIVRLEEALADYVLRYGLTDRARALLCEAPIDGNKEAGETVRPMGLKVPGWP